MKKFIIILSLVLGCAQLRSAEKAAPTQFEGFLNVITPKAVALFPGYKDAYKHPLVPSFLKSEEVARALVKYDTPQPSFWYNLGKMGLIISPVVIAYCAYRHYYPALQAVYAPQIETNTPITNLNLTITYQKNGWLNPLTFPINTATDRLGYQAFLRELQGNLTGAQKTTTGESRAGNIARLETGQTYTFFIEGTVTYRGGDKYELRKERIITTQDGGKAPWILSFWNKNIAVRITSVWPVFPHELITDQLATYHAVICDATTQDILHSISIPQKQAFKEAVIEALADEILPATTKQLELKISITQGKNRFARAPLRLAVDTVAASAAIRTGLQHFMVNPKFRSAQRAYATQLWNISGEPALAAIAGAAPQEFNTKVGNVLGWASSAITTGIVIAKLKKEGCLFPIVSTTLGIATLVKMRNIYTAHRETYH